MNQLYESEILIKLMERDGFNIPSSVPRYESEIKAYLIGQVKQAYPKLTDYEAEWLLYNYTKHLPAEFPVSSVSNVTNTTFSDVVPFAYQSAILKGQTLVNIYDYTSSTFVGGVTIENGVITLKANGGWVVINNKLPMLKPNTNYTIFVNILSNTLNYSSTELDCALRVEGDSGNSGFITGFDIPKGSVGIFKKLLTTKESLSTTNLSDVRVHASANGGEIKFTYMIIEGDHSNENIPYFTGMQSVKMPVLTTTGKNLLKYSMDNVYTNSSHSHYAPVLNEDGSITLNSCYDAPYWLRKGFYVEKGKEYTVTVKGMKTGDYSALCFGFDNLAYLNVGLGKALIPVNTSGNCIDTIDTYGTKKMTCTALETGYVTRFYIHGSGLSTKYTILEFQVEEGDTRTTTSYEPYKSNILTVNEPIELRGIDDMQDTLDCLTGELTERIGRFIEPKDCSVEQSTFKPTDNNIIAFAFNGSSSSLKFKSSKLIQSSNVNKPYSWWNTTGVWYVFRFPKADVPTTSDFKQWLLDNEVLHTLRDPVIKTVDLTCINQDGKECHFMPIEGRMNVSVSSNTIEPLLDMTVPVEATTQNLASFINLKIDGDENE